MIPNVFVMIYLLGLLPTLMVMAAGTAPSSRTLWWMLTLFFWPLALMRLMVVLPVKAIRTATRRRVAVNKAIASAEDYLDYHISGAARREYEQGLRETEDRKHSISFWRGVLSDEQSTESEKVVARQLLSQYYDVPEVAEKAEVTPPCVEIRSMTDAEKRAKAMHEAAELLAEEAKSVFPTGLGHYSTPGDYTTALPGRRTCRACGGTGRTRGSIGFVWCSECGGEGSAVSGEDLRTEPDADQLCDNCGEIFLFNSNVHRSPTWCKACVEEQVFLGTAMSRAAIMSKHDRPMNEQQRKATIVVTAVREQLQTEMTPENYSFLREQLSILKSVDPEWSLDQLLGWLKLPQYDTRAQWTLGARVRTAVRFLETGDSQ